MSKEPLATYIDHSILKPEFTQEEIVREIARAVEFGCKTVCINPASMELAVEGTAKSETGICVVCDFPFGTSSTVGKLSSFERLCRIDEVDEIDVVANYGWIKSGLWEFFEREVSILVGAAKNYSKVLKLILETDALSDDEIVLATQKASRLGVDFVKSSTGFFSGGRSEGASIRVMKLMLESVEGSTLVKGSGGIRTREHFLSLIDLGVGRMGIGFASTDVVLGLR